MVSNAIAAARRAAAAYNRILVKNPVAELDGDEMARVVWHWIKERLVLPYVNVPILYFDLGLPNRNTTDDAVTVDAARAVLDCNVGIKCATITPDAARLREFGLRRLYRSPNATLREALDGTVFREPILLASVPRLVPGWRSPIVIGRHAFADVYAASELSVSAPGTVDLVYTPADGGPRVSRRVHNFSSPGVALAMFNVDSSIGRFAHASFRMALSRRLPLFLSTKNTILKVYDSRFLDIFEAVYEKSYKVDFGAAGLTYEHRLIDDMVAYALKSAGGFVWACKNYDGDVQSDIVAQGFGSLGLMTSTLVSSDGRTVETEAAHGTVTRHFRGHEAGRQTSTNPIASIYAWTQGLAHRAALDSNERLQQYCTALERACISAVDEDGVMTRDLAVLQLKPTKHANTQEFIAAVEMQLQRHLSIT